MSDKNYENQYFSKGIYENQSFQEEKSMDENTIYENHSFSNVKTNKKEPPKSLLLETQKNVNDLVEILHENVDMTMKRGNNLNELTKISSDLERNAGQFKTNVDIVKRKVWWKQMKTKLVLGGLGVILLLILIFSLIQMFTFK